jgi:tyrosyl-tRNA synthetase
MKSDLITTLNDRGFINQATNLDGLDQRAMAGPIIAYIGFDLTADSLHVGSLVQIMMLRWMHKLGHDPIVLFGEATTRIGDPTGKSTARPILTPEEIERNRIGIVQVIDRLVGSVRPHTRHVSNGEWFTSTSPSYMDFLARYGHHFSINRMMTLDTVKTRLDKHEPLSFLEFNYMLMQAVDFLKLYETRDCVLQVGGSDQWGNIINGVELVRRVHQAEVFGLTTPLMTNSAGEKMGKTASGAVWLDPNKTSAFEFWQFWRNVEDEKVGEFLRLFTELPMDEITRLEILGGAEINEAKKVLATEVTAMVHGRATAEHAAVLAASSKPSESDPQKDFTPVHAVSHNHVDTGITLAQILLDAGLVSSKTQADKLAANGGVKVNGTTITNVREEIKRSTFSKSSFTLTVGKKKIVSIRIGG